MRVCDVHHDRMVMETVEFSGTKEVFDLCSECSEAMRDVLRAKPPQEPPEDAPKRRGRPPK